MCGIVGILGSHEAAPILVEALKRLEYRGYDSAGIATLQDGKLDRRRAKGKLVNLSDLLVHHPLAGRSGIGHTRWATHGAPTETNAHPHRAGPVAVVHNGIIENYREILSELSTKGYTPNTETDTEAVALLAQSLLEEGLTPQETVLATIQRLSGAFALAFLFDGEQDLMIGARKGSPLAVGIGKGETYLGSDAIALAPMTHQLIYLEEGDIAILSRSKAEILDMNGKPQEREIVDIQLENMLVDKQGYRHFMAKEIAEQPNVLSEIIASYTNQDKHLSLGNIDEIIEGIDRIIIIGCGTALLAGMTAKYWFESIANLPVETDIASEFRYREPPIGKNTLVIAVSQSGETADTLAALRYAKGKAKKILSITNVATSSIAREADFDLQIRAGVEVGVASTKAFTAQLSLLYLLALASAQNRGELSDEALQAKLNALSSLPGLFSHALGIETAIQNIGAQLSEASDVLYLGRGLMFPLALEGALKLKEISYIHAEGYASGELKHGPIALIDAAMPVVVIAPKDTLFDKTISNMQEVIARGANVILISDQAGISEAGGAPFTSIELPELAPELAPILYALPIQLLAYHTAIAKGTDVDQPRNLAKSVTVE